jgi:polysaccharide biosynthesis transport protein
MGEGFGALGMEEETQEITELIDFGEIKGIIRRQRWLFLGLFFFVWILIWAASWVLPSIYRSGTLILVEQPAVPEKLVASNIDIDIQRQLDSISEQILSRTRLLTIIQKLDLYAADRKHKNPDEMVDQMRKDIDIELVRSDDKKLSAFNIYYSNPDPDMAQKATNELANLFIVENLEQRQERSENTTKFLQDQLEQARQKLAEQEARVREFKDKHPGELPSQTPANLQILTGLQEQLRSQQDSLSRAKQQNTYLESLLSQYKAMGQTGTKSSDGTPTGLADIDRELERLKDPDVRKTKEQIERTEKMREKVLADMKNSAASAPASANAAEPKSTAQLEMESQLKANRIEIANHEAEIRDLEARVGEYQGRLNMAPVMEQQFADITRDYEQSKTDYDSLLAKKNQSEMATDLEKTQQGEHFRMLDPPNRPSKPFKPNRLQLCALGLIAGIVMGGGASFAREKLSGRVFSEREIKKLLPFEVISEIPPIETPAEQVKHRRGNWMAAIASIVIVGTILIGSAITYLRG